MRGLAACKFDKECVSDAWSLLVNSSTVDPVKVFIEFSKVFLAEYSDSKKQLPPPFVESLPLLYYEIYSDDYSLFLEAIVAYVRIVECAAGISSFTNDWLSAISKVLVSVVKEIEAHLSDRLHRDEITLLSAVQGLSRMMPPEFPRDGISHGFAVLLQTAERKKASLPSSFKFGTVKFLSENGAPKTKQTLLEIINLFKMLVDAGENLLEVTEQTFRLLSMSDLSMVSKHTEWLLPAVKAIATISAPYEVNLEGTVRVPEDLSFRSTDWSKYTGIDPKGIAEKVAVPGALNLLSSVSASIEKVCPELKGLCDLISVTISRLLSISPLIRPVITLPDRQKDIGLYLLLSGAVMSGMSKLSASFPLKEMLDICVQDGTSQFFCECVSWVTLGNFIYSPKSLLNVVRSNIAHVKLIPGKRKSVCMLLTCLMVLQIDESYYTQEKRSLLKPILDAAGVFLNECLEGANTATVYGFVLLLNMAELVLSVPPPKEAFSAVKTILKGCLRVPQTFQFVVSHFRTHLMNIGVFDYESNKPLPISSFGRATIVAYSEILVTVFQGPGRDSVSKFNDLAKVVIDILYETPGFGRILAANSFNIFLNRLVETPNIGIPRLTGLIRLLTAYLGDSSEVVFDFERDISFAKFFRICHKVVSDGIKNGHLDDSRLAEISASLLSLGFMEAMGGGFTVRNPFFVVPLFKFSEVSNKTFRRVLEIYTETAEKTPMVLSVFSKAGLTRYLIKRFERYDEKIQENKKKYLRLLTLLCGHSLKVSELKSLLRLLRPTGKSLVKPVWFRDVVTLIYDAIRDESNTSLKSKPMEHFRFSGRNSYLLIDPIPFSIFRTKDESSKSGYTVSTWIRIDEPTDTSFFEPRLYSFLNKKGEGIECFLRKIKRTGNVGTFDLCVRSAGCDFNGVKCTHLDGGMLESWMNVVVVHSSYVPTKRSEANLWIYINGECIFQDVLPLPNLSDGYDHLDRNRIGSNFAINSLDFLKRENNFRGMMTSFSMFATSSMNKEQLSEMWSSPTFFAGNLDAISRYYDNLILHVQPELADDLFCYNQSGKFPDLRIKKINVIQASRSRFSDVLYCLGGIRVFYPLFLISNDDALLVMKIIGLVLTSFSDTYKEDFLSRKGFKMISYLIKQMDYAEFVGEQMIDTISDLFGSLADDDLRLNLSSQLILDFELWSLVSTEGITFVKMLELWFGTLNHYFTGYTTVMLDPRVISEFYIYLLWKTPDPFSRNRSGRRWTMEQVTEISKKILGYLVDLAVSFRGYHVEGALWSLLTYALLTPIKERKLEVIDTFLKIFKTDNSASIIRALARHHDLPDIMSPFTHLLLQSDTPELHQPILEILFYVHRAASHYNYEYIRSDFKGDAYIVLEDIIHGVELTWEILDPLFGVALELKRIPSMENFGSAESVRIVNPRVIGTILKALREDVNRHKDKITTIIGFLASATEKSLENRISLSHSDAPGSLVYFCSEIPEVRSVLVEIISGIALAQFERSICYSTLESYFYVFMLLIGMPPDSECVEMLKDRILSRVREKPYSYVVYTMHLEISLYVALLRDEQPSGKRGVTSMPSSFASGFPFPESGKATLPAADESPVSEDLERLAPIFEIKEPELLVPVLLDCLSDANNFQGAWFKRVVSVILAVLEMRPNSTFDDARLKSVAGIARKKGVWTSRSIKRKQMPVCRRGVAHYYSLAIVESRREPEGSLQIVDIVSGRADALSTVLRGLITEMEEKTKDLRDELRREWFSLAAEIVRERGPFELWNLGHTQKWKLDSRETMRGARVLLKQNLKFDSHFDASSLRDKKEVVRKDDGDKERDEEDEDIIALLGSNLLAKPKVSMADVSSGRLKKVIDSDFVIKIHGALRLKPLVQQSVILRMFSDRLEISKSNRDKKVVWLAHIREIHQRRYLYEWTGFEIFTFDGNSFLIVIVDGKTHVMEYNPKYYELESQYIEDIDEISAPEIFSMCFTVLVNLTRVANPLAIILVEKGGYLVPKGRGKKYDLSYQTRRWVRGYISNFDYLSLLNTVAGRSLNDLTQYPVFPWVLVDYTSDELNLQDPSVYRDLGKPIGILKPEREEFVRSRYEALAEQFDENEEDFTMRIQTMPHHYGSHYLPAGVVLYYLIRLEPYTSRSIELQDNRFDAADRLFDSIKSTFENTQTSSGDFKELIPEFFYQPEFLLNTNNFDLGMKQDRTKVHHIKLPPWANGSPVEFIVKNRTALESLVVRENLNKWIDLIFGAKSRGKAAIEAVNVFAPLTYASTLKQNRDLLKDNEDTAWINSTIENFGQCPPQLFRKPHERSSPVEFGFLQGARINSVSEYTFDLCSPGAIPRFIGIFYNSKLDGRGSGRKSMRSPLSPKSFDSFSSGSKSPINAYLVTSDRLLIKARINVRWMKKERIQARVMKPGGRRIGISVAGGIYPSKHNIKMISRYRKGGKMVVTSGYFDHSVRIHLLPRMELVTTIREHRDISTCVDVEDEFIATGGRDTLSFLFRIIPRFGPIESIVRLGVFRGHDDEVLCIDINSDLQVFATGSRDGTVIINSITRLNYIRTITINTEESVLWVKIIEDGFLFTYATDGYIRVHTVNGRFYKKLSMKHAPIDISINRQKYICAVATENSEILIICLPSLRIEKRIKSPKKVYSVKVTEDGKAVICGTKNGMSIYLIDYILY